MWRHLLIIRETQHFQLHRSAIKLPSTHRTQNVSPAADKHSPPSRPQRCNRVADSLIGIQLPLAVVQPSHRFANRCACAVPSYVRMTTHKLFLDWLNFPGKRKITQEERGSVYDRSKHNRNGRRSMPGLHTTMK